MHVMVCEPSRGTCGLQAWPEGMAGIELKVNGFSHKLPLLLEQLVQALVSLKVRMACSPLQAASAEHVPLPVAHTRMSSAAKFSFHVSGLRDLNSRVMTRLLLVQVDAGSFTRNKEVLIQKYQNANMHPDRHASYLRLMALKQRMWRLEDVLSELQALTPQSVQVHS